MIIFYLQSIHLYCFEAVKEFEICLSNETENLTISEGRKKKMLGFLQWFTETPFFVLTGKAQS